MSKWISLVRLAAVSVAGVTWGSIAHATSASLPVQFIRQEETPPPADHPFVGHISLEVDATDTARRLYSVRERIPVQRGASMTLLYPRWEAASHGPSLTATDLAGLQVSVDGRSTSWRRDPIDPHAFRLNLPPHARMVEANFQIVGDADHLSADLTVLPWQRLLLYPAGWYTRNISVAPAAILPAALRPFTSLDFASKQDGRIQFATVTLETLLDSPLHAARYAKRFPLTPRGPGEVFFTLMASRPQDLAITPEQLAMLQRTVYQARTVFGAPPFRRYEILARMSDDGSVGGTEHRSSSEISLPAGYFRDWRNQLNNRDIIAHEFVHAWNGLYRVPADLWAPTPNIPEGGSLLWVYEGLTEFWGRILAARAGLRSSQETLDRLAIDAAEVTDRPGRQWRALSDDVNYPSFMLRQSVPWRNWQRRKDYYLEGVMLWLQVDAMLRERSGGLRGIDDFSSAFFSGASPEAPARTYSFEALCAALNQVAPFDWPRFLRAWVDGHEEVNTTAGLIRHGWQLAYDASPTLTFRQSEEASRADDLSYSVGLSVDDNGVVTSVSWKGPAFEAGMAPRVKVVAVAGAPFSRAALLAAVRDAARSPITLTWEQDRRRITRQLMYLGTLRYPWLERVATSADGMTRLLAAR